MGAYCPFGVLLSFLRKVHHNYLHLRDNLSKRPKSTQTLFYRCLVAHSSVLKHFWVGKGDGFSIGKSDEKQGSYVVKMYKMIGHSSIHCRIRCCKKDLFVKLVQSVLLGDTLYI